MVADGEQRVAVVIPAKNEADHIASTIRTCKAIPHVDLIVVVDDGSTDDTSTAARRAADAVVVRHSVCRGKGSALETGAKVVAMRETVSGPDRLLLFLDADLGESAAEAAPLVEAVMSGKTDCAIAVLPPQPGAGGHGFVRRLAFREINRTTGFRPTQPLSGQRCLTRAAYEVCEPLSAGWGVEVAMTIDLLTNGFRVQEIPCPLSHEPTGNDLAGNAHRFRQLLGVTRAALRQRIRGQRIPVSYRDQADYSQTTGEPYRLPIRTAVAVAAGVVKDTEDTAQN